MPVLRRGKGEEQRGIHSHWDGAFFFFPFLSPVMIAEKSHFTTDCHVCKTASVKAHPRTKLRGDCGAKFNLSGSGTHRHKRWRELTKWWSERGTWGWGWGWGAPGQTLTPSASLVANGLLIEVAIQPGLRLLENDSHPRQWSGCGSDHSTWDAVVLSRQPCRTTDQ